MRKNRWLGCIVACSIFLARPAHAGWDQLGPGHGNAVSGGTASAEGCSAAPDGAGGVFLTWIDHRGTLATVYAMRLTRAGYPAAGWSSTGMAISGSNRNDHRPAITADGVGGAIIVWDSESGASHQLNIHAMRISQTGAAVSGWPSGGMIVCDQSADQHSAQVVSDASGGAYVAWEDERGVVIPRVFSQHLLANGTLAPGWVSGGEPVTTSGSGSTFSMCSVPGNAACVVWTYQQTSGCGQCFSVNAQKLEWGVTRNWGEHGVSLFDPASAAAEDPTVISDGQGGVIAAASMHYVDGGVYVQRIDSSGNLVWGSAASFDGGGEQFGPALATDGAGGCYVAFLRYATASGDAYPNVPTYVVMGSRVLVDGTISTPGNSYAWFGNPLAGSSWNGHGDPYGGLYYSSPCRNAQIRMIPGSNQSAHVIFRGSTDVSGDERIFRRTIDINGAHFTSGNFVLRSGAGLSDSWAAVPGLAVASDGLGGCFVGATGTRSGGGVTEVVAQLVDASGDSAPDVEGPNAISNLVVSTAQYALACTWTAPADLPLPGASVTAYDLRYSISPITEANFSSAIPIETGTPEGSGGLECFVLSGVASGLFSCTNYWVAVRSRDAAGNWSPISNVKAVKTKCSGPMELICGSGMLANLDDGSEDGSLDYLPGLHLLAARDRSQVRLSLVLPEGTRAKVDILDLQGRIVSTLLDGDQAPAASELIWNGVERSGRPAHSGVFFARCLTAAASYRVKFVLVR